MLIKIKEQDKKLVLKPEDVADIFRGVLRCECKIDQDKEHLWVLAMDTRNIVKYMELVGLGTLNTTLVHPREVFRRAITEAVAQLVICHNHPSGDIQPSTDDICVSQRLVEAGKLMGIEVVDFVIISQEGYFSFKEKGLL
jgi:DNA repair protein RadC